MNCPNNKLNSNKWAIYRMMERSAVICVPASGKGPSNESEKASITILFAVVAFTHRLYLFMHYSVQDPQLVT